MNIRDEIQANRAEVETLLNNPFCIYLTNTYPCTRVGLSKNTKLNKGGFDVGIVFAISIRVDELGAVVPANGKPITIGGVVYRIELVYLAASGSAYHLWLSDPSQ